MGNKGVQSARHSSEPVNHDFGVRPWKNILKRDLECACHIMDEVSQHRCSLQFQLRNSLAL